jgi:hypothetical protein
MDGNDNLMYWKGSSLGASLLRAALFALAVAEAEWIFFLLPTHQFNPIALAVLRYLSVAMFLITGSMLGLSTFRNTLAMFRPHSAGRCPGPAVIVGIGTMVVFVAVFWSCVGHL